MGAGRDEQPILLRNQRAMSQPMRRRVLVGLHAAETLIAHQINQIAAERLQAVLHAVEQFGIVGLGRQVHRQIDDLRVARHRAVPPFGRRADEGALSDAGFDQAALLRLDIAAGDSGEIDVEMAGKFALRRQSIQWSEPAAADVLSDRVGDGEIARLAEPG